MTTLSTMQLAEQNGAADLTVFSLYSSGAIVAGSNHQIKAAATYYGSSTINNVSLRFYSGDPRQGGAPIGETQIITQMTPGKVWTPGIDWTPPAAGDYTLFAWVDPDNTITEVNETNNVISETFTVRAANLTWYVDAAATGAGDGQTPATAFQTLEQGLAQAVAGDTVKVAAGEYSGGVSVPPGVMVQGAGDEITTIKSDPDYATLSLASSSVISGFTLLGSGADREAGIAVNGGDALISHNRIISYTWGIILNCYQSAYVCNKPTLIDHNIIAQNTEQGISGAEAVSVTVRNNTLVANNIGVWLHSNTSVIENNLVVGAAYYGILAPAKAIAQYNDVWGYAYGYDGVAPGADALSVDPDFLNQAAGDYRLHAGSPVIGRGTPAGVDMGALPFTPVGEAPAGLTVTALSEFEHQAHWNASSAAGYNLYLGSTPGLYNKRIDVGSATTYNLTHLPAGAVYLAIAHYDAASNESALSPETTFAIPPLSLGAYEEASPAMLMTGSWASKADAKASGGAYITSNTPDDTFSFTFKGDSFVLLRKVGPNGGFAKATLDGKAYGVLSFYFFESRDQVPAIFTDLGDGLHTLTLTVTDMAAENSTDNEVMLDKLTLPSPYATTTVQQQALNRVNYFRQLTGLPLATGVQAIHQGAQSHAEYYANNHNDPRLAGLGFHTEQADLPGYTGKAPWERARYFGYTGSVGEDGHFVGDPVASVDGWMETLYHRNLILCYGCIELGYGMVNDKRGRVDALNMGSRTYVAPPERLLYTYPASGQTNIPVSWGGGENPDPLVGKTKPVGYPISLYIGQPATGNDVQSAAAPSIPDLTKKATQAPLWKVTKAELATIQGVSVPTYFYDQNTDPNKFLGPDVIFLIPQKPLAADTTYVATMSGEDSRGKPFDQRWVFATGATLAAPIFTQSTTWAEPAQPTSGQAVTFFTRIINTGIAAEQVSVAVNLPDHATYSTGSAQTSQGTVTGSGPLAFNLGRVAPNVPVTLSYGVTLDAAVVDPLALTSPVAITWESGKLTLENVVIANGRSVYLPLVGR